MDVGAKRANIRTEGLFSTIHMDLVACILVWKNKPEYIGNKRVF